MHQNVYIPSLSDFTIFPCHLLKHLRAIFVRVVVTSCRKALLRGFGIAACQRNTLAVSVELISLGAYLVTHAIARFRVQDIW